MNKNKLEEYVKELMIKRDKATERKFETINRPIFSYYLHKESVYKMLIKDLIQMFDLEIEQ